MVYASLLLEEQRFAHTVGLIAGAGVQVGSSLPESDIARILGIDTIHKLNVVTTAIVEQVDAGLKSLISAHDALRIAMRRMYPNRNFVNVEFQLPTHGV